MEKRELNRLKKELTVLKKELENIGRKLTTHKTKEAQIKNTDSVSKDYLSKRITELKNEKSCKQLEVTNKTADVKFGVRARKLVKLLKEI